MTGVLVGNPTCHSSTWLSRFHEGNQDLLAECYEDYFGVVERVASGILKGADAETVIHEVFYALISDRHMRASFKGGSFASWIAAVARNRSIDALRRRQHELRAIPALAASAALAQHDRTEEKVDARQVLEAFRTHHVPDKWRAVFDARFVAQLSQREAARELKMSRTTLAYQEQRIRGLLRRFALARKEEG